MTTTNTIGSLYLTSGIQIEGRIQAVLIKPEKETFLDVVCRVADDFDEAFRKLA